MVSVPRIFSLVALLSALVSAQAAEPPPRLYQADVWGKVELAIDREHLVGYATAGNPCGFKPRDKVLEGVLQGRVLVGQFTLCLQGESCPKAASLPVLGFYSSEEGSLTAYVRPRKGCQSPVLGPEGLVVLRSPEAIEALTEAASTSHEALSAGRVLKRNPEAAKQALVRGEQLAREKKWSGAATEFERGIALGDASWVAYFGLGMSQLMRNQVPESIDTLERAQTLNKREPNIPYYLACAHSRLGDRAKALFYLEQAVRLGLPIDEGTQDMALDKLLGSDAASLTRYSQVLRQAFSNAAERPAQRRQAQGP